MNHWSKQEASWQCLVVHDLKGEVEVDLLDALVLAKSVKGEVEVVLSMPEGFEVEVVLPMPEGFEVEVEVEVNLPMPGLVVNLPMDLQDMVPTMVGIWHKGNRRRGVQKWRVGQSNSCRSCVRHSSCKDTFEP